MPREDRLTALLNQSVVTGIDFIQVVDPADQTCLRVFFLVEPDTVNDPDNPDPAALPIVNADDLPINVPPESVVITSISGGERLATVPVVQATYRRVRIEDPCEDRGEDADGDAGGDIGEDTDSARSRTVLEIRTAEPGDFSIYQLTINAVEYVEPLEPQGDNPPDPELRVRVPARPEPRIDRFFNGVEFSFKQGCPSPLDCKPPDPECPPETLVDFPIDYLARDFVSLRNALLDFAAQRYPDWTEKIEADAGVMLAEVMAALGDEFSYIQDRYAREAHWETITQRRSLRHHARLIDYHLHDGLSASTFLDLTVSEERGGVFAQAGSIVWAPSQGEAPIPFELGAGLFAQTEPRANPHDPLEETPQQFWVHAAWNAIPVHVPDEGNTCLPVGATELFLRNTFPTADQLPGGKDPATFWVGKWLLLETHPAKPSIPVRRHLVRVVEVEQTTDPLCLVTEEAGGAENAEETDTPAAPDTTEASEENTSNLIPLPITRIQWEVAQALPFEMCLRDMVVRGNLVWATAGETFTEYFSIGPNKELLAGLTLQLMADINKAGGLGQAIERQGPLDDIRCRRNTTYLYSLKQTETQGLGWLGNVQDAKPEIELQEVGGEISDTNGDTSGMDEDTSDMNGETPDIDGETPDNQGMDEERPNMDGEIPDMDEGNSEMSGTTGNGESQDMGRDTSDRDAIQDEVPQDEDTSDMGRDTSDTGGDTTGMNGAPQDMDGNPQEFETLPDFWRWKSTLLDSTRFQDHFTLEDGTWRRVIGFRRIGETITHTDYASGSGFTIRFGDGEFGRIPDIKTIFRVRYRTGPGTKANLPADTIVNLTNPADGTPSVLIGDITAISNPFPITNGRDPEPAEVVKQLAPEAFRALTFRAVRPEDYAEIAERLPWVQRAGARFRWTGSWLSTFVTADPLNAFELSPDRRRELTNLMDCVRQVGREVYVRNPRYVNLDLEIQICIQPSAYAGQVQARVLEVLLGRRGVRPTQGFFDPDHFTFGTPLKRSALEATIQAVAGVRAVERMCIRVRGITPWRPFSELTFTVGSNQIIRLRNDPRFPDQGSVRIFTRSQQQDANQPALSCKEDPT